MKEDKKKVYIKVFGCQMNDRDSEALLGLFLERGYIAVDKPEEADVILVNTCSVRDHAENRAISFLGSLKKLRITHDAGCGVCQGVLRLRAAISVMERM